MPGYGVLKIFLYNIFYFVLKFLISNLERLQGNITSERYKGDIEEVRGIIDFLLHLKSMKFCGYQIFDF